MPFRIHLAIVAWLLIAIAGPASAGKPEDWTEAEVKLTAPYCIDTMGFKYGDAYTNTSPRAAYWVSLMGPAFWGMHHYCWALVNLGRAERAGMPEASRRALRESAAADIKYSIKTGKPGFIMHPELYTKLGSVYLLLRDERKAQSAFQAAILAKADYWPPYARWAEHLMARNARDEAKKIVRLGLVNAPTSRTLKQLWAELGGGPLPEPAPPKAKTEAEGEAALAATPDNSPAAAEGTPAESPAAKP